MTLQAPPPGDGPSGAFFPRFGALGPEPARGFPQRGAGQAPADAGVLAAGPQAGRGGSRRNPDSASATPARRRSATPVRPKSRQAPACARSPVRSCPWTGSPDGITSWSGGPVPPPICPSTSFKADAVGRPAKAAQMSPLAFVVSLPVRFYRLVFFALGRACLPLSPDLFGLRDGGAWQRHGALKGSWLAARRIARCHPWGGFRRGPNVPD